MACTLHEESIDDFFIRFSRKIGKERIPYGGGIEVTTRCNLSCIHCYCGRGEPDLPADFWKKLLDDFAREGCFGIYITGGEPLLRDDFFEIYEHARKAGIMVTLFTNGTLLNERNVERLLEYPPYSVEVSVYGASEETYAAVTGDAGAFEKCMAGLDNLHAAGIRYLIKTVLLKTNVADFDILKKMAEERGVPFRYDAAITPSFNSSIEPAPLRLSPSEIVDIESRDTRRMKAWRDFISEKTGIYKGEKLLRCGAGLHTFFVDSRGYLHPCMMLNNTGIDLKEHDFGDAFLRLGWWRELKRDSTSPCAACPYGVICEQCPGWSLWVHGDLQTKVDFLCATAHMRVKRFGRGEQ